MLQTPDKQQAAAVVDEQQAATAAIDKQQAAAAVEKQQVVAAAAAAVVGVAVRSEPRPHVYHINVMRCNYFSLIMSPDVYNMVGSTSNVNWYRSAIIAQLHCTYSIFCIIMGIIYVSYKYNCHAYVSYLLLWCVVAVRMQYFDVKLDSCRLF